RCSSQHRPQAVHLDKECPRHPAEGHSRQRPLKFQTERNTTLERGLVGQVLGWPSAALFGASRAPAWLQKAIGFYYDELPYETQKAVFDKATAAGVTGPGEALFWVAFAKARGSDRTMARLADFLNQY
ncbi:MAG: hypothetical protein ACOZJZ_04975, partial [Pseudomonadota bacterium]